MDKFEKLLEHKLDTATPRELLDLAEKVLKQVSGDFWGYGDNTEESLAGEVDKIILKIQDIRR